ncbi:sacsin N-terminal ATP-binding-like domain-containing protein [Xylanimonas ulmi]|uniref:Uncharacterized protein n=1 Tax=Xylanimonas ulmi TaxID=228973 RepID=A0A4Q7M3H0_9MICO|nr:ATP-binding protein [Xylanibacterium ulmi]RZS62074.1 hypothetical protein EV386_2391 [Xylanibacterium ulmi]
MTADPFGTQALRRAVLDAWRASPTRLREDANLEEDHARGYYRDRVVVELAQNAADAAARAGVPGRLTLRLDESGDAPVLRAANTGAPLDADAVASLASLRASSKGAGQVGRFGVGFAAVRAVSDDVTIRSATGGVRFSAAATRAQVSEAGIDTPPGHLAVLRLPFAAEPAPGDGAVVELTLRDREAVEAVRAQLDAVDDALLLALPALAQVVIEVDGEGRRMLDDVGSRWLTRHADGELAADDVADLPTEQRRTAWSLVWALPRSASSGGALGSTGDAAPSRRGVLYAPTPTDVPLTFPALLVATFPVDPGRRRVLPGRATERLAAAAGRAYAALLADVAAEHGAQALALVPGDLPAGEVDAAIREAAIDALRTTPLLPAGDGALIAPRDAVLLVGPLGQDADVAAVLGAVPLATPLHTTARRLGARVAPVADLLEDLPSGMAPAQWRAVYAALAPHAADPAVREALAGAAVPLADGRVAHGARGLVMPATASEPTGSSAAARPHPQGTDAAASALRAAEALGVRVVHPEATHPVLERVGAAPFDPRAVLADPAVRSTALAAAQEALDAGGEPGPVSFERAGRGSGLDADGAPDVVDAVLWLAGAGAGAGSGAGSGSGGAPFWVGEMPVRVVAGGLAALRETALPGSWAATHLDALDVVDPREVAAFGAAALRAAGTHDGLDLYTVRDVVTPGPDDEPDPANEDDPAGWLAGWSDYLGALADHWGPDVLFDELDAVADLDAVAEGSWPDALARIASDPDLRRTLLAAPRPGAGARRGAGPAPSYTAWWLRRRLGAPFALHDDVPLLPPVPAAARGLDDEALRALGGVGSLGDVGPDDWPTVLDALPPVGASLPLADAFAVWRGLAAIAADLAPEARASALASLPDRLPALRGGAIVVADADDVVVAPASRWAQLGPVLPAPPGAVDALADLLDLPVAQDRAPDTAPGDAGQDFGHDGGGEPQPIDARVAALDPRLPASWRRHDRLTVAGVPVAYWAHDGVAHATSEDALAGALADLLGAPHLAAALARALAQPEDAQAVWTSLAWGG